MSTRLSPIRDSRILGSAVLLAAVLLLIALVPTLLAMRVIALSDVILQDTDGLASTGQEINSRILDQESGVRGFALTGDERLLEPYSRARSDLPALWAAADQRATAVDGAAPGLVSALRGAAEDWQKQVAEAEIELVRAGRRSEAVQIEASGRGKEMFDRFREHADALTELTARTRKDQAAQRERLERLQSAALIALALFGLLGLVQIYQLATRSQRAIADAATSDATNRAKDEFLSIAAHELRTPLTSIKGHAQMLVRQGRTALSGGAADWERAVRHAASIDRQSSRLTRLIEQLLEVTGAESKLIDLRRESVDLVQLAEQVAEQFRPIAPIHPIAIQAPDGPVIASVDRPRFEQVLYNLIDNALKYSPEGGPIDVRVSRSGGEAICAVSDRGVGVAADEHSRLFDRFYRATNVVGTSISGLGVGLYITRAIVLRHGGRIWIDSQPDRGSTFYVAVPISPP
jgi:signal transduction histidine kinase